MIGYVGERARRKKRNTVLFFIFIIVLLLVYLVIPNLQMDKNIPSDAYLPSEKEILSPEIKIETEELELQIFQKEQKIIFRDQQINKLKNKIDILTIENKKLRTVHLPNNKVIFGGKNNAGNAIKKTTTIPVYKKRLNSNDLKSSI